MAHVTEIQNGAAPPPPPTKRTHRTTGKKPTGRPVTRSQEPAAPEVLEIDDMTDLSIFEQMARYPAEEWDKKLSAYLYRLAPVIDRGKTGNYHNVQMYSKPVTQDEIMRASYGGSGKYRLILKRYDPDTRDTLKIKEEEFSILNQDFPPCIPFGEWIDDDKNREWAWAKPQLERIAKEKANGAPPPTAAAAGITDPTFGAVFTILERFMPKQNSDQTQALATEVIATMRENHKEQMQQAKGDPQQLVSLVTTIVGALKPAEAPRAGSDPLVMQMLENMRADLNAAREREARLLEKLFAPENKTKAPTLAEQIKDLVDLKGSIGTLFGRGNPGAGESQRKTDWGEVVARTAEKILEEGPRYMAAIFSGRPPARTINHPRPPAAPGAPAAPPDEARELTPSEQEEQAMAAIQDINTQFGSTFDEFTPELVKTFDRDLSGMDFRDWFIEEFGARVYSFLRKMDVRTILGVIELRKQTAPDHLRPQLALLTPPEKVEKFILEFQSNEPAPTYDDAEEEAAAGASITPNEKDF
jgi:uncharacterized protein YqeY